jgi:putative membrane protein
MLWLTSVTIVGFTINGFGSALLSAIVLSIISFAISMLVADKWFHFR